MSADAKYPRTFHLPWSPGATSDDKVLGSTDHFVGREIIVTEKMDGENTTIIDTGKTHARSLDSKSHPSRDWVRGYAAEKGRNLPKGWRICGENLFAKHSISYIKLSCYFLAFSIWDENNVCLSWDDFVEWCDLLDLVHVPVLYRGPWDTLRVMDCYTGTSREGGETQEGYVVRVAQSFKFENFASRVAKFVRANHVTTDEHWINQPMTPNLLRKGA